MTRKEYNELVEKHFQLKKERRKRYSYNLGGTNEINAEIYRTQDELRRIDGHINAIALQSITVRDISGKINKVIFI